MAKVRQSVLPSDSTCSVALICIPFKLPSRERYRLSLALRLPRGIMHIPTSSVASSAPFPTSPSTTTSLGGAHFPGLAAARDRHTDSPGKEREGPLVCPRRATNHQERREGLGCENYALTFQSFSGTVSSLATWLSSFISLWALCGTGIIPTSLVCGNHSSGRKTKKLKNKQNLG